MSSGVHKTFNKKRKTTDFENYSCLFKKHTQSLVIEVYKGRSSKKTRYLCLQLTFAHFPWPFPLKKKKLSSSPSKRGKGNKLCKFKGQKCDEKEILETYGDVRKLLTWNV